MTRKAIRLGLSVLWAYLAVSFTYAVITWEPWLGHHAHNLLGGWLGVLLFFPVIPLADVMAQRDTLVETLWRLVLLLAAVALVAALFHRWFVRMLPDRSPEQR